jgi:hypothetical protein
MVAAGSMIMVYSLGVTYEAPVTAGCTAGAEGCAGS